MRFPDSSRLGPLQPWTRRNKHTANLKQAFSVHVWWGLGVNSPPISELLGDVQMLQVVVDSPLILLQEGVGVAQAVAGLSLHHLVPQLPRQLQRLPTEWGAVSQWWGHGEFVHQPLFSTRGQTLPTVLTCSALWRCWTGPGIWGRCQGYCRLAAPPLCPQILWL